MYVRQITNNKMTTTMANGNATVSSPLGQRSMLEYHGLSILIISFVNILLIMTKTLDIKQPYSMWLSNQQAVNRLKTQSERVGYPLEFSVRKIFRKNNYEISNAYYLHSNEENSSNIWREIDIYSSKKLNGFDIKGCKVSFRLFIIGDCKYSSTVDLFAFRSDNGKLGPSFPILYNAENFFESPYL
jgi:hypothetical protein